jgi:hypothetical protein
MPGAEASILSSQISLLAGIIRERLTQTLQLNVSEEARALLVEALDGVESMLRIASAVAPRGAIDDGS